MSREYIRSNAVRGEAESVGPQSAKRRGSARRPPERDGIRTEPGEPHHHISPLAAHSSRRQHTYLVTRTGDEVERYFTVAEVIDFLGPIDPTEDLRLLLSGEDGDHPLLQMGR